MKFDWKNIDWLSPKPSKERAIIGIVLLAVLLLGIYLGQQFGGNGGNSVSTLQPEGAAPQAASGNKSSLFGGLFGGGGAAKSLIALQPIGAGQCHSFAPEGWRVTDQNQQGTVFSLASPDGSMGASYAGLALNGGQIAGYYGPQFQSPENLALYSVGALTNEQAQATGSETPFGDYRVLNFATANHKGYVLLYTFPVPADPQGVGVIMRIAIGSNDPHSVGIAGSVAAAARCQAVLIPSRGAQYEPPKSGDDHGTGKSDDGDMAGTYNAQLGTGWVHDDAGNNYNVDVTTDYRDGPDGPGYYKVNGNDVTKLTPGLQ